MSCDLRDIAKHEDGAAPVPRFFRLTGIPGMGTSVASSILNEGMGHDTVTLSAARSRLDQRRFSRPNTHVATFFKIFKNIIFSQANLQSFCKFSQNFLRILQNFQNS